MRVVSSFGSTYSELCREIAFDTAENYDLLWALAIIKDRFGITIDLSNRHLLIGVDEFSELTDYVADYWTITQQREFSRNLQSSKRIYPFVQYVFTGFHTTMASFLKSSARVNSYTLSLCDFSAAQPLLQFIIQRYMQESLEVPSMMFECVKSTPGLLGYWAEMIAIEHTFPRSLPQFQRGLTWYRMILREKKKNFNLIARYMKLLESDRKDTAAWQAVLHSLGEELINSEMGVGGAESGTPMISPLCFTGLVNEPIEELPLQHKRLQLLLRNAVGCCEQRKLLKREKEGYPFESFLYNCLKARILLRLMKEEEEEDLFQTDNEVKDSPRFVRFLFNALLPGDFRISVSPPDNIERCDITVISKKEELQQLLTIPLYYLFPLGTSFVSQFNPDDPIVPQNSSIQDSFIDAKSCESVITSFVYVSTALKPTDNIMFVEPRRSGKEGERVILREEIKKRRSLELLVRAVSEHGTAIYQTSKNTEGCDTVAVFYGSDEKGDVNKDEVHIAVFEVKDRHDTTPMIWKKKVDSLLSERSLIHDFAATMKKMMKKTVHFHIVLVAREHDYLQ